MNLPDKTQLPITKLRELIRTEPAYVILPEVYRTVRGRVQTSQQMQQRALAGAGFAHQRKPLAARDLEVEAREDHQVRTAGAVALLEAYGADQGI